MYSKLSNVHDQMCLLICILVDPLQTLDICHEIVNMTFCSEGAFTMKKCSKKRCVDRYDSSESSDRYVHRFNYLFMFLKNI